MDIFETIKQPWKNPVAYSELLFWFIVFVISAYAMADGMRIAISFVGKTAKDALN